MFCITISFATKVVVLRRRYIISDYYGVSPPLAVSGTRVCIRDSVLFGIQPTLRLQCTVCSNSKSSPQVFEATTDSFVGVATLMPTNLWGIIYSRSIMRSDKSRQMPSYVSFSSSRGYYSMKIFEMGSTRAVYL